MMLLIVIRCVWCSSDDVLLTSAPQPPPKLLRRCCVALFSRCLSVCFLVGASFYCLACLLVCCSCCVFVLASMGERRVCEVKARHLGMWSEE
jgi:hypothetical protein